MAAALAVTEPCSTGPGGDAFCLFYSGNSGEIKGINGRLERLCFYYFHDPGWFAEPLPLCPQWSIGSRSDSWLHGRTWLHGWGSTFTFSCLKHYSARGPGMLVWYCSAVWQPEGLTILKVLTTEEVTSLSSQHGEILLICFWKITNKTNTQRGLAFTLFTPKQQWITLPAPWGFLRGNTSELPLPVSIADPAGGAEGGRGARTDGVSCGRGGCPPLGKLGCCFEKCWEGTGRRLADWWPCTQKWTNIPKPCPGPDPEGTSSRMKPCLVERSCSYIENFVSCALVMTIAKPTLHVDFFSLLYWTIDNTFLDHGSSQLITD